MAILELKDQNLQSLQYLSDDEVVDLSVSKELSGNYSLSFDLPMGANGFDQVKNGYYIGYKGQNFTIERVDKTRGLNDTPYKAIDASHIFFENDEVYMSEDIDKRGTIYDHLSYIFEGTNFYPVAVNNSEVFNVERHLAYTKEQSKLDAFKSVIRLYDVYFTLDGFSIRLVARDTDLPSLDMEFAYAVNNQGIEKSVDSSDVVTVLYASGSTVHFDPEIEEFFPTEDENGEPIPLPRLKLKLKSPTHIKNLYRRWRPQFKNFGDIQLINNLKIVAQHHLDKYQLPKISYSLTVAELKYLSNVGDDYEFDIGYIVKVKDTELGINIIKPIQRYSYKPLEPHSVSQIVIGDKPEDIYLHEERDEHEDGDDYWVYDEKLREWVYFPAPPAAAGEDYRLYISRHGDFGTLKYRYKTVTNRYEESTLNINNIATYDGEVTVNLYGASATIPVYKGESRNAIAKKIASQDYEGWETERNSWSVTFKAIEHGSKPFHATYDEGETNAEGNMSTVMGSIANEFTSWKEDDYSFNMSFGDGDTVEVKPINSDEPEAKPFTEWLGDGEHDYVRTFVMDDNKDALAVYGDLYDDEDDAGDDHSLYIGIEGGSSYVEYRYLPSVNRYEKVRLSIDKVATIDGVFTLKLAGDTVNVTIVDGDSRNAIAEKIETETYNSWSVTRDGWNLEFTANETGSKPFSAYFETEVVEANIRITKGSTAGDYTDWHMVSLPLSMNFGDGDIVEVKTLSKFFLEWVGDGTGSPTRTFTMDQAKDATMFVEKSDDVRQNLYIDSSGDAGDLRYRFIGSEDRPEKSTVSINNVALGNGSITVSLHGASHTIPINKGDSRNDIATAIAAEEYNGWYVTRNRWSVEFEAKSPGSKPFDCTVNASIFEIEIQDDGEEVITYIVDTNVRTMRGSEEGVQTDWLNMPYAFSDSFGYGDTVQVEPLGDGFLSWEGNGSGSYNRTFIMDDDRDATAVYEDTEEDHGDMYNLNITEVGLGEGHLLYRFTSSEAKREVATLTIRSRSYQAGSIAVILDGTVYGLSIPADLSRVQVAERISNKGYSGWETEYDGGWTVKFTATSYGRKSQVADFDSGDTECNGSFSVQRGSTEGGSSEWIVADYPLNKRFDDWDTVAVIPNPDDQASRFDKWTGEGSGEITRNFVMTHDQDATAHFGISKMENMIKVKILEEEIVMDPYGDESILRGKVTHLEKYSNVNCGFYWSLDKDLVNATTQSIDLDGATGGWFQINGNTFSHNESATVIRDTLIDHFSETTEQSFDLTVERSEDIITITNTLWTGGSNISANFGELEGASDPKIIGSDTISAGTAEEGETFEATLSRTEDHGTIYYVVAYAETYDEDHDLHVYAISEIRSIVFPYSDHRLTFSNIVRQRDDVTVDVDWKIDGEITTEGTRYYPQGTDVVIEIDDDPTFFSRDFEFEGFAVNVDPDPVQHLQELEFSGATSGWFYIGNSDMMRRLEYDTTSYDILSALIEVYRDWDADDNVLPTPVEGVSGSNGSFTIEFKAGKGGDLKASFFLEGIEDPTLERIDNLDTSNPMTITMDQDTTVYAVFKYHPPEVIVTKGSGQGFVRIFGVNYDLPCNISELISDGIIGPHTLIHITAVPDNDYYFADIEHTYKDGGETNKISSRSVWVSMKRPQEFKLNFTKTPPYDGKKLAQMMYDYAKSLTGGLRDLDVLIMSKKLSGARNTLAKIMNNYRVELLQTWRLPKEVFISSSKRSYTEPDFQWAVEKADGSEYYGTVAYAGNLWLKAITGTSMSFSRINRLYRRATRKAYVTRHGYVGMTDGEHGTIVKTNEYDPNRIAEAKNLSELEKPHFQQFVNSVHSKIGTPEDMYMEIESSSLAGGLNAILRIIRNETGNLSSLREERKERLADLRGDTNEDKLTAAHAIDGEPFINIETEEPDPEKGIENDIWVQYEDDEEGEEDTNWQDRNYPDDGDDLEEDHNWEDMF